MTNRLTIGSLTDTRKGAMKFKNLGGGNPARWCRIAGSIPDSRNPLPTNLPLPKCGFLIPIVIASALIGLGFAILAVRIFTK